MLTFLLREWKLSDAQNLASAINNKNVLDNLRDGIPYPYAEQDGKDFITAMLSADKNSTFAFAIEIEGKVVGSIAVFRQNNIHFRTAELGYYLAEEYSFFLYCGKNRSNLSEERYHFVLRLPFL